MFATELSAAAAAETLTARRGAALLDRSAQLRLSVSGADRQSWLQGLVTNDVARLTVGQGCGASALTAKGKLVGELRLFVRPEVLWLSAEADAAAGRAVPLAEHLNRYLIMEDCALEDVSAALAEVALIGPQSAAVAAAVFAGLGPLANCAQQVVEAPGLSATAIGWPDLGLPGFTFWLPDALKDELWQRLREAGAQPLSEAAVETLRIEAGRPREGRELDGEVIPLEARLESEISDSKGCYLGQEIIARVSHRGHVNRRLTGFVVSGELPDLPAELRLGERVVGDLRSAVRSPTLGETVALGYLRRELLAEGTVVQHAGGTAQVVAVPFVRWP